MHSFAGWGHLGPLGRVGIATGCRIINSLRQIFSWTGEDSCTWGEEDAHAMQMCRLHEKQVILNIDRPICQIFYILDIRKRIQIFS